MISYLLSVLVTYEGAVAHEDSRPYSINDEADKDTFSLSLCVQQMKRKAGLYAEVNMLACHLIQIKALVVWNSIKKEERKPMMLDTYSNWASVEKVILHRDGNGKKSLGVDLSFEFSRAADGNIPPSIDDPVAAVIAHQTKRMTTATMKLQKEAEERAALQGKKAEEVNALKALHACKRRLCENFGRYCWHNSENDQHYAMSAAAFVT